MIGIYKQNNLFYSEKPPYFPCHIFKEYPFKGCAIDKKNQLYSSLRELFKLLKLDLEKFDTKEWNPFGSFISPGDTVLLKPNFVKHFNERGDVRSLITHGSLIRAVVDYAYIALKGKGRIIIADGPMDETDFSKIIDLAALKQIKQFYKDKVNFNIEVFDLRQEVVVRKNGRLIKKIKLEGDPAGYTAIDLKEDSEFKRNHLDYNSFSGPKCRQGDMSSYHNETRHEYLISNTLLQSDVVIDLPKMKTHKRAGVTLALKNMIGISENRHYLPHFSKAISNACKRNSKRLLLHLAKRIFSVVKRCLGSFIILLKDNLEQFMGVTNRCIQRGDWHGNNIISGTIIDLAYIVSYADKNGIIKKDRQRKIFVIMDGIIAGEGNGPLLPQSKKCGVLIAGFNALCADIVTTRIMGFDPMKVPKFRNISKETLKKLCNSSIGDISCVSNINDWNKNLSEFKGRCLNFKPHHGWKNHIEVDCV